MGEPIKLSQRLDGDERAGVAHAFWTDPLQLLYKATDKIDSELPSMQLMGLRSQVKRCEGKRVSCLAVMSPLITCYQFDSASE